MALSGDVRKSDGSKGPLAGKTLEQIYRAHHNLDSNGDLLPGFVQHGREGCECDDCEEYLMLQKTQKETAA